MQVEFLLIIVVILIISTIIHEVAHGYAALSLGDPTAKLAGRLTLNPVPHIDPLGTVLIPAVLVLSSAGFIFGYAKPVPYNPYNFRKGGKWGEAFVAFAGPGVNILLAIIFGLLIRFSGAFGLPSSFVEIASFIVFINILLALFNLIPFPPLDGSKVIKPFLPFQWAYKYENFGNMVAGYGLIATFLFLALFIFVLWPFFFGIVSWFFTLLTGTVLF